MLNAHVNKLTSDLAHFQKSCEIFQNELQKLNCRPIKDKPILGDKDETVNFLFKRTREIAELVSSFYARVYGRDSTDTKPGTNVLSYETIQLKLEKIFRDYEWLVQKNKKNKSSLDTRDTDTDRLSTTPVSHRNRRPLSINLVPPHATQVNRSKSPVHIYVRQNSVFSPRVLLNTKSQYTDNQTNIPFNN